jgi:esterase/lipase
MSAVRWILVLLLFPTLAFAECLDELERTVAKRNALFAVHYEQASKEGIRPDNEWKLYRGTRSDEAVLLVHGFIASPWEVEFLAQELNANGYTVLLPLIEGFGGSTWMANHTSRSAWKRTFEESFGDLSRCYPKIALGGFSLGGGLVLDFVLRNGELDSISSIFLLAPYVKPKMRGTRILSRCAGFFCNSISLKTLETISANDDLRIPVRNPGYYNRGLPLEAVHEISLFSRDLLRNRRKRVLGLPVFLAFSESDHTVDVEAALKFVTRRFSLTSVYTVPDYEKVPHQIAIPDGRNHAEALSAQVLRFLR